MGYKQKGRNEDFELVVKKVAKGGVRMKMNLKLSVLSVAVMGLAFAGCSTPAVNSQPIEVEEVAVVEAPAPAPVKAPVVPVSTQRVNFDFDSSDISSAGQEALAKNAAYLAANPKITITVEGHCDDKGTVAYNLALGQRRAESVKDAYINLGISASRITTVSYGKERPLVTGTSEAQRALNRRAETKVN
jgi:peptidoglycan-associated lipoprotein